MNKNKEKVPKIRFPGFTEPWEQRKFDEIFTMLQNNALSRADLNSEQGSAMNVHYGDILIKFGECLDVSKEKIPFITDDTCLTKYKESFLVNGDVIIADAAEDEAVGKCSEIVGLTTETVISGLHTIPCRANKVFANGYLGYYMNSNAYHNQLLPLIQGTKVSSISKTALKDTIVLYPKSTEEQALISQYFTKLNNLITLHQRKLNHLKDKKKGLLQKMFPKNGELVPELRFPEFTAPWEQRKLGEVSEKVTEKNKNNIYSETLTNSAEYGIINQRDFFDKDISNEKNLDGYYIVRPDDFVYNPRISNYAPVGPINRNNLGRSGVMSPLYYVFRTHSVDKIFLEKYFSSNNWHKFMKLNGDSGARADRFAIKDSVFREMPIPSPAIEEQTKIGEFFQGIDNLITLHQRKLDHLKEQKKALLQQMFI